MDRGLNEVRRSTPVNDKAIADVPYTSPRTVASNGVELMFDAFGAPDAPALLLIAGLGCQMIAFDERFCAGLAARGYRVIRFDNRDIGLSSHLDHLPVPNVRKLMILKAVGLPVPAPYMLHDMAADTVGLLDALDIAAAHLVGVSMGGAIAQEIAIRRPERVRTLTSIMSSTGDAGLPPPTAAAMEILTTPSPKEREAFRIDYLRRWKTLRGDGHPDDEARDAVLAERLFDRGLYGAGLARQLAAVLAAPGRARQLASVRAPALVIHGDSDPLAHVRGGHATAKALPHAELRIIEGMGHALPERHWPTIIDAIARHAI